MNRLAGIRSSELPQAPLIAVSVVVGFCLLLLGVMRVGLPIWSLVIPVLATVYYLGTLSRPMIGLFAVLAVFFAPVHLSIGVSLLQLVGGTTALLLLLWFLYNRHTIVIGGFMLPLLLIGLMVLVSLLYTRNTPVTLMHLRRWVFNMLFVTLMLNLVTNVHVFKKVLWAVMIMASVNSVAAMIDFAGSDEYGYRSMGLMENANNFGHLAALAFPLALYQYLYAKGRLRWVGLALSAILAAGVVMSVSRGALISLVVVFSFVIVRERRRLLPLLLIAALAAAVVPFMPRYFLERSANLAEDVKHSVAIGASERNLTSRGHLNKAGLRIWAKHPVIGVGIGNFGYYYSLPEFTGGMRTHDRVLTHNIYVQALAEMGLIGFGILMWLLINAGLSLRRARRKVAESVELRRYFGAVEMMTLAILVSTATYGSILGNDLWMFLSLAAIAGRVAPAEVTT